jgi:hypothetical protein
VKSNPRRFAWIEEPFAFDGRAHRSAASPECGDYCCNIPITLIDPLWRSPDRAQQAKLLAKPNGINRWSKGFATAAATAFFSITRFSSEAGSSGIPFEPQLVFYGSILSNPSKSFT